MALHVVDLVVEAAVEVVREEEVIVEVLDMIVGVSSEVEATEDMDIKLTQIITHLIQEIKMEAAKEEEIMLKPRRKQTVFVL